MQKVSLVLVMLTFSSVFGQIPTLFNYQGFLSNPATGSPVEDGNYSMTFAIYNVESGGDPVWKESQTVQVSRGIYSIFLGSVEPLTSSLFSSPEIYLGLTIADHEEMAPRKRIVSVAYALVAESVYGMENRFPSVGNVGIGTKTPSSPLEVNGIIHSMQGGFKFPDGTILTTAAGSGGGDGDITAVNAGVGLSGGATAGDVNLDVNIGKGLQILSDSITLDQKYIDVLYVNEGQTEIINTDMLVDGSVTSDKVLDNSLSATDLSVNLISSLDGVTNDGGNIDLVAGSNITILPDDNANSITISASNSGGGDITAVNAGQGLAGGAASGDATLDVNIGAGLQIVSDVIKLDQNFCDNLYVEEGQLNSITHDMIADAAIEGDKVHDNSLTEDDLVTDIISSIDGVTNDGGNIDLVAGSNITIVPDDVSNKITISANGNASANTLDQAYDEGGPGAGRTIIADAGAFTVGGKDGVLFTGLYDNGSIPMEGDGIRFMWYSAKGALRSGRTFGGNDFWNSQNIGEYSSAFGLNSLASGYVSTAFGVNTKATGLYSTALGYETTASGNTSMATGYLCKAIGDYCIAFGKETTASGDVSIALGYNTTASEYTAVAMGELTTANNRTAIAFGYNTTASGEASTAMGKKTLASGDNTTSMGYRTSAIGVNSVAMGMTTEANGPSSVSLGGNTKADGDFSIAMGYGTNASGFCSTTMGYYATASGYCSTAMGFGSKSEGENSIAIGFYTSAKSYNSLALGQWNLDNGSPDEWIATDAVLTIGNGTGSSNRQNCLQVTKNGNMWLKGTLTQNSDVRLKKDIEQLEGSIEKLKQIKGITFTWKDTNEMGLEKHNGILAQDVEKVYPELVGENSGFKTVDYNGLIPVLIEAVKEQQKMIEDLQEKLSKK